MCYEEKNKGDGYCLCGFWVDYYKKGPPFFFFCICYLFSSLWGRGRQLGGYTTKKNETITFKIGQLKEEIKRKNRDSLFPGIRNECRDIVFHM